MHGNDISESTSAASLKTTSSCDTEDEDHCSLTSHSEDDSGEEVHVGEISKTKAKQLKKKLNQEKKRKEERQKRLKKNKISKDDFYEKNAEFRKWLNQEKSLLLDFLPQPKAKELFKKFVKKWNSKKLSHDYYRGVDPVWAMGSPSTQSQWAMPGSLPPTPSSIKEEVIEKKTERRLDDQNFSTFGRKAGAKALAELRKMDKKSKKENVYDEPVAVQDKKKEKIRPNIVLTESPLGVQIPPPEGDSPNEKDIVYCKKKKKPPPPPLRTSTLSVDKSGLDRSAYGSQLSLMSTSSRWSLNQGKNTITRALRRHRPLSEMYNDVVERTEPQDAKHKSASTCDLPSQHYTRQHSANSVPKHLNNSSLSIPNIKVPSPDPCPGSSQKKKCDAGRLHDVPVSPVSLVCSDLKKDVLVLKEGYTHDSKSSLPRPPSTNAVNNLSVISGMNDSGLSLPPPPENLNASAQSLPPPPLNASLRGALNESNGSLPPPPSEIEALYSKPIKKTPRLSDDGKHVGGSPKRRNSPNTSMTGFADVGSVGDLSCRHSLRKRAKVLASGDREAVESVPGTPRVLLTPGKSSIPTEI